jgi:hypothetical protein
MICIFAVHVQISRDPSWDLTGENSLDGTSYSDKSTVVYFLQMRVIGYDRHIDSRKFLTDELTF